MSELDNNVIEEQNIIQATDSASEVAVDDEAELASLFASDIAAIEEEAAISEDLEGFANGFPDWDLHPPK